MNQLSRKFADIADDHNNDSNHQTKRRRTRTRHESPPANSDEETSGSNRTVANERFVYQAGHKFFLLHSPWVYSGEDIFDTDVDEHYDPTERFENDKNKMQGQLKEILGVLQEKFQQEALSQRWLQRQVSSVYVFTILYLYMTSL